VRTKKLQLQCLQAPTFYLQLCMLPECCAGATGSNCWPSNMAVEVGSSLCEHGVSCAHSNCGRNGRSVTHLLHTAGHYNPLWLICCAATMFAATCVFTPADGGLPPAPHVQDEYVSSRWDNPLGRSRSRGSDSDRVWEQEERGRWPEPGPGHHLPEPATASVYIKVIRGISTTGRRCLQCVLCTVLAV
jgi:hypothetical protein